MSDAQWARLAPLLPAQRPRTGRPARDHRTVVSAILWVLRTRYEKRAGHYLAMRTLAATLLWL